jgi:ABC-type sugar transport system permease subunit
MAIVKTQAAPRSARVKAARAMSNINSPAHRGDARLAWILIIPALVGFLAFFAYPTFRGIYLSFTKFTVFTPPQWIGFDNFVELAGDDVFWNSLFVTLYYVAIVVVVGTFLSLVTAVVLHRLTASTVVRGMIILPFLISNVVAATVWSWILDAQLGIVNIAIEALGGESIMFLTSRGWVIPAVAIIGVWKSLGYTAIIIFAGLQTVPASIYEAGRIDGASEPQMFRRLTLPLMRPILAMVLVLNVIGAFQVFDLIQVTTKGGPANASLVLQSYIFGKAFGQFDFGYASAMALTLFVFLLIITFTQLRLLRASESDTN